MAANVEYFDTGYTGPEVLNLANVTIDAGPAWMRRANVIYTADPGLLHGTIVIGSRASLDEDGCLISCESAGDVIRANASCLTLGNQRMSSVVLGPGSLEVKVVGDAIEFRANGKIARLPLTPA